MKKYFLAVIQRVWPVLLGTILFSQTTWAQTIPDAQWAHVGRTLAITTDGNIVTGDGGSIIKYALSGDVLQAAGPFPGTTYLGGKLAGCSGCTVNGYAPIQGILKIAPTTTGGIIFIGYEYYTPVVVLNKLNAGFGQVYDTNPRPVAGSGGVVGTPGGGYLEFSNVAESEYINYQTTYTGRKVVGVAKTGPPNYWSQKLFFPAPNPATPDVSLTHANTVINTPDGGYLIAGYFNASGTDTPESGWVAKLDGQGNVNWQKLLTGIPAGSGPGQINAMRSVTDVSIAADGTGYALAGMGVVSGSNDVTALLELDPNGNVRSGRAKAIDTQQATDAFITLYVNKTGNKYYAVGNSSLQNGIDPQILLIDPAGLTVVAKRTFEAPGDGPLTDIGMAGDGSIVFVTANNQLVKLLQDRITLAKPTYDCATGAITFNTLGGDGSPITYSAPGVIRSSATSNTGTVEQGLRNDPKVILITATQNGVNSTYNFDLRTACGRPIPVMPLYYGIPDLTFTVGQDVLFEFGDYFFDLTPKETPNYFPDWQFNVEGLPEGLALQVRTPYPAPYAPILGKPTKAGIYTVNATVSTGAFRNNPIRATFRITILPNGQTSEPPQPPQPPTPPQPPVGGALAMTQPTYNCQTGAITFNTTGGDGSSITYNAPGISRSSLTSNTGTVEQGLRNDPKPITITATQSGNTVSYTFNFGAYCANPQPPVDPQPPTPPTGTALMLLAPTYDCASGAITFRTSGGNGSTTEYASPGITGWTTNPNQFVDKDSRTANDVQPFTLMARQNGVTVTYVWDLKAACGRARVGVGEPIAELSVVVLGNPVRDAFTVEIRGIEGKPLRLGLVDARGRMVESREVEQAAEVEQQRFGLAQQGPGLFMLRVSSDKQSKVVKLLKQ